MDKIRIDHAAFQSNSLSLSAAITDLAIGAFVLPPSESGRSKSTVLNEYRAAAQDLYSAVCSYKELLIRDYEILQNVSAYLSEADQA